MSKHILNLSVAIFFLTLSGLFVLGAMRVEKTLSQHEENMAIQQQVYADMRGLNSLLYEGGLAVGARVLAEEGVMTELEADKIVDESISQIEKTDSRLGQIAKSINYAVTGRR